MYVEVHLSDTFFYLLFFLLMHATGPILCNPELRLSAGICRRGEGSRRLEERSLLERNRIHPPKHHHAPLMVSPCIVVP